MGSVEGRAGGPSPEVLELQTTSARLNLVNSHLPFPNLPGLSEIAKQADPALTDTARHELGHAVVARSLGETPEGVSIVPNYSEGYLGITTFSYAPAPSHFILIAAGGGNHGDGSDNGKIEMLGGSVSGAKKKAEEIKNSFASPETHTIAAQILANPKFQDIPGSYVDPIYKQAELYAKNPDAGKQIKITFKGNDKYEVTKYQADGKMEEFYTRFDCCGGRNMHTPNCEARRLPKPEEAEKKENKTEQESRVREFPIFVAPELTEKSTLSLAA